MIRNILLIDDDEDDHIIFKEALTYVDDAANCSCVFSGYEGVKLLETFTPDFVFLDVNMPALNGLDCLDMIKKNTRMNSIPIVMYSTGMDEVICDRAFQKGAYACVKKIASIQGLARMLQRLFDMNVQVREQA